MRDEPLISETELNREVSDTKFILDTMEKRRQEIIGEIEHMFSHVPDRGLVEYFGILQYKKSLVLMISRLILSYIGLCMKDMVNELPKLVKELKKTGEGI